MCRAARWRGCVSSQTVSLITPALISDKHLATGEIYTLAFSLETLSPDSHTQRGRDHGRSSRRVVPAGAVALFTALLPKPEQSFRRTKNQFLDLHPETGVKKRERRAYLVDPHTEKDSEGPERKGRTHRTRACQDRGYLCRGGRKQRKGCCRQQRVLYCQEARW